jgi:hypothetical protein
MKKDNPRRLAEKKIIENEVIIARRRFIFNRSNEQKLLQPSSASSV